MLELSGGIPLLHKVCIILGDLLRDLLEQTDAHPKTATKIALGKCCIVIEIHPHQLVVAFDPFPPQFMSTKNRATYLRRLVGSPSQ
jgi:hypothetical protein